MRVLVLLIRTRVKYESLSWRPGNLVARGSRVARKYREFGIQPVTIHAFNPRSR